MRNLNRMLKPVSLIILVGGVCALCAAAAMAQDDYTPTVEILTPELDGSLSTPVPPSVTFHWEGSDPDGAEGLPAKIRFLLVRAEHEYEYLETRAELLPHLDELTDWSHQLWSGWLDYPADPGLCSLTLPDQTARDEFGRTIHYLLMIQVMDADGAVSTGREYGVDLAHFHIVPDVFQPEVALAEVYLGQAYTPAMNSQIAAGQPLFFFWSADASSYGGTIVSTRYGWDLMDPDNPSDPGWQVPPGAVYDYAPEQSFNDGIHIFYLLVEDDSGQSTLMTWTVTVIPFVPLSYQSPLLLIDQVVDDNSGAWPDPTGVPRDRESFRNAYWQFLEGPGGVADFDWNRDRIDHREQVNYADLVEYQAVLCYARVHSQQLMFNQLRPVHGVDRFVWLGPYQQRGGNFFLVGGSSMDSFLEILPNYLTPIIFESHQETIQLGAETYVTGFGLKTYPDGTTVERGPLMYPYATAGISALDWTSTSSKYYFNYEPGLTVFQARRPDCVGLKALALDDDFRANHGIVAGDVADTVFTDPTIDWLDVQDEQAGTLDLVSDGFPFRRDEFVDVNLSGWPYYLVPQECAAGPGGACIEPMFRGVARLDYVREVRRAAGDTGWPLSVYTMTQMEEKCGEYAFDRTAGDEYWANAATDGQTFGYLSYKMVGDKPSGQADVYWGFDPYRFDHQETQKAIRWVLDYFGLQLQP